MALPTKKIKYVKVPGTEQSYEIIPERLQKNGYEAVLPTLTTDSTIALAEKRAEITLTETELNNILASSFNNPCALTRTAAFYNQFTSDVKVLDVYCTYVEDEQPTTIFLQSLVRFEEMEEVFTFYGLTSPSVAAEKALGSNVPSDR